LKQWSDSDKMKIFEAQFKYLIFFYFLVSSVVIFAYLSIFNDSAPAGLSPSDELSCMIKHLKTLNKLEQSYPDNDSSAGSTDCEIFVIERTDLFETEVISENKIKTAENVDCLRKEIEKRGLNDEASLVSVYNNSAHLSDIDRNKKISESDKRGSRTLTRAFSLCKENMIFGEAFDDIRKVAMESDASNSEDELDNYCIRKYVVDKGLIDTNLFKVTLNPNNVNIKGLDCEEHVKNTTKIYKSAFKDGLRGGSNIKNLSLMGRKDKKELNHKITKCAMRKYDEMNVSGRVLSILVLGELNLTYQQIATERENFIEAQRQLANAVIICGTTYK